MASPLSRLAKCKHHLHVLKSSSSAVQKVILQNADKDLILSLCEICLNILRGHLRLDAQSLASLRKYKTLLRAVARVDSRPSATRRAGRGEQRGKGRASQRVTSSTAADSAWKRKRRILVQKGKGPFLTSLLTSALGGLVGKLVTHFAFPNSDAKNRTGK